MEKNSATVNAITEFLYIGKEEAVLSTYDLVIFLGNDDIKGNAATIKHLYDTSHITDSSKVILSGNVGSLNKGKKPEAKRLFEEVVKMGLPADIFFLETEATNALENFKFSKTIIESIKPLSAFNRILCIGNSFLGRRAMMSAAACGYPTEKIDYYGSFDTTGRNIGADTWWQSETTTKRILEELKRIAEYSLKGDLSLA